MTFQKSSTDRHRDNQSIDIKYFVDNFIYLFFSKIVIAITNPGGLVIIVTLTKHKNKRINNKTSEFPLHKQSVKDHL